VYAVYARVCICKKVAWFRVRKRSFTSSPYIRIYPISHLRYNHVIIMSYLKRCCVLMWYYVFAIKLKYYERKKVWHITIPLRYSYDSCICLSNIIQISQKSHFTIKHVGIKKEIRIDFLHRASYISTCTDHYHHFLPLNHHPLRVLDYSLQNI